jgi:acyl carrier protein
MSITNPNPSQMTEPAPAQNGFAPPNDVERQLTAIWQELLGIDHIERDQNYFDLGGDSSLAVHLFVQIENVFGVKLPIFTLFEAPTVAELAQVLSRDIAPAGWNPLVAIQPKGTRTPFFCMHGAGGNVLIYRELSKLLGDDQPFYGLQSQGLDGDAQPLTKIEDMAALYVKEIRRVQPTGPYLLGGYCLGGTIAYEVAQQLRAQGQDVALLALLDTTDWSKIPTVNFWNDSYMAMQRFYFTPQISSNSTLKAVPNFSTKKCKPCATGFQSGKESCTRVSTKLPTAPRPKQSSWEKSGRRTIKLVSPTRPNPTAVASLISGQ